MFFTDEKHKGNYELLMKRYNLVQGRNVQYEASIYIAAIPEIYKLLNFSEMTSSSPLFTLTKWNEIEERHKFVAAGLTGSTRRLCELALSLYNDYPVGLDDIFGAIVSYELVQALFQAMQIRARQSFLFKDG